MDWRAPRFNVVIHQERNDKGEYLEMLVLVLREK
jgi:hypothetical protein